MKKIYLIVFTFLPMLAASMAIAAQNDDSIRIPQAAEISKITFAPVDDGETAMLTRQSLLAILPRLIPAVEPTYLSDTPTQDGTIVLKNGTILEWSTVDGESLYLREDEKSELFFVFSGRVEKRLTLPKAADIAEVSFLSGKKWLTRISLLKILPGLVPSNTGFYLGKVIQRGTLTLKDGTILHWTTAGKDHLVLRDGKKRRLYGVDYRGELTIPKAEDIREIHVESSGVKRFTPESLHEALPKFVAGGTYKPKMLWQYGGIELKTGVMINWRADGENTLVLFNRSGETYFQMPAESSK